MNLYLNGHTLVVGQMGPDFIIMDDQIEHPPADAEVSLSIDGDVRRWPIHLPEGISPARVRTRIAGRPRANKVEELREGM